MVFKIYPASNITFYYEFKHTYKLKVDPNKIFRVLYNIIVNALQAMNYKGDIFFFTRNISQNNFNYIEFSIKNSNSFIEQINLNNIFDAFYTRNKRSGTGLGLAIVKKIINDHSGNIWCESEINNEFTSGYAQFTFTLPSDEEHDETDISILPKNTIELSKILQHLKNKYDNIDKITEIELIQCLSKLDLPASILIVDDEEIYYSSLAAMIYKNESISDKLKIKLATSRPSEPNGAARGQMSRIF